MIHRYKTRHRTGLTSTDSKVLSCLKLCGFVNPTDITQGFRWMEVCSVLMKIDVLSVALLGLLMSYVLSLELIHGLGNCSRLMAESDNLLLPDPIVFLMFLKIRNQQMIAYVISTFAMNFTLPNSSSSSTVSLCVNSCLQAFCFLTAIATVGPIHSNPTIQPPRDTDRRYSGKL